MREVKVTRQEMDESESENCVNSTRVEGKGSDRGFVDLIRVRRKAVQTG